MGIGRVGVAVLAVLAVAAPSAQATDYLIAVPVHGNRLPAGYLVRPSQARAVAGASSAVRGERRHGPLRAQVSELAGNWQVSYFRGTREVARATVSGRQPLLIGKVVAGPYVEIHSVYHGRSALRTRTTIALVVLSVLFLAPFLDRRRALRLAHLDLLAFVALAGDLVLLSYGHAAAAVPLQYMPLLYLLARCVQIACGSARRGSPAPLRISERTLIVGIVVLVLARAACNLWWAPVGDVGYSGAFGADSIIHGWQLYTFHPAHFDTYGPVNYLLYVPFSLIWPLGPDWAPNYMLGVRLVAILADTGAIALLTVLGRRVAPGAGGRRLGLTLAYAWVACPLTFAPLIASSNDALVALAVLAALVAASSPVLRGAALGFGAAAKFAPLALVPLFAIRPERSRSRAALTALVAAGVFAGAFLPYLHQSGLHTVWESTGGYQVHRDSAFTLWGLHPSLGWLHPVAAGLAALVIVVTAARRAPEQGLRELAAGAAAVLIAVEIAGGYWSFNYVDWFAGAAFLALLAPDVTLSRAPARTPGHVELASTATSG